MGRTHALAIGVIGLLLVVGWLLTRQGLDPERRPVAVEADSVGADAIEADAGTGVVGGPVAPAPPLRVPDDAVIEDDIVYTPEDVEILRKTLDWARAGGLDTMAIGDIMVRIGRRFVGADYTPHTLDPPGPERLIVNLREFDCVTYLESVLAISRMIRSGESSFQTYAAELRRIRYRNGVMDGYPSRLHYFSEWIADNEQLGLVTDVTEELGGRADEERIDFMSTHADAYAALDGNPDMVREIRRIERRLSDRARYYIGEDRIADLADGIRDGDIIAATSSVKGLDVAHTGMALWIDGRLHLMHAPLVGKSVEISVRPLAERILRIEGQDGIMVARPR